jgi:hypothetical protein
VSNSLRSWRATGLALLGSVALGACSSDPGRGEWVGDYITTNNFESVLGWGAQAPTLSKEHAHSGRFAVRVDANNEYGQTFDVSLAEASVHPLKGVRLDAWVYLPSTQATGALVLQILDTANNGMRVVHSEQLDLAKQVRAAKEWTPVQHDFVLPAALAPGYRLRVYLWRSNSPEPVYLDDISLKALE